MTALRLLAVLNVLFKYASAPSGARLVLTGFSRTSPRHVVRKADQKVAQLQDGDDFFRSCRPVLPRSEDFGCTGVGGGEKIRCGINFLC